MNGTKMRLQQKRRIAACAASFIIMGIEHNLKKNKEKRKRRWWVASLYKSRIRYNVTDMLGDLRREPSNYFLNFCRMSSTDFEFLLNKIGPVIAKKNTNMRESIPIQERLAVTLRFLATGDSFASLSYLFKFSPQTVSRCVQDVCRALNKELKDKIILPKTPDEWRKIAQEFEINWNFPHCLGAIDGKHIVIEAPMNSGTEFFNYKGTFSVVLMALVNANYEFTYVDIGCQGRISDGGVFRNTTLFQKLDKNELMLPPDEPLRSCEEPLPYVFVGDDAFALSTHLLKPYPGMYDKGSQKRIFNYRLSRARRLVENAFGILASVFRIFRKPMLLEPDRVTEITMTCVLLHNFLRNSRTSNTRYLSPDLLDNDIDGQIIPGSWRAENDKMTSFLPLRQVARRPGQDAKEVRDRYANYFSGQGAVPWQNNV